MPRLSDSMEEGTILKWLVADGAHVRRGQELVEIETDKATIVHVSEAEGALEILAPEGASLPVGAPIACVGGPVGAPANGAQTKSLGAIARETRCLTERVRSGAIAPPELSGATFTVSNLGMFGMTAITPVINPPQAAILGVGSLRETLARVDGEIVERTRMTLTLSCDHRILYGADAARLLGEIRDLMQAPLALAL